MLEQTTEQHIRQVFTYLISVDVHLLESRITLRLRIRHFTLHTVDARTARSASVHTAIVNISALVVVVLVDRPPPCARKRHCRQYTSCPSTLGSVWGLDVFASREEFYFSMHVCEKASGLSCGAICEDSTLCVMPDLLDTVTSQRSLESWDSFRAILVFVRRSGWEAPLDSKRPSRCELTNGLTCLGLPAFWRLRFTLTWMFSMVGACRECPSVLLLCAFPRSCSKPFLSNCC